MALGRQVRSDVDAELREHGLSLRHLSALGHLAGQPGLSYSELARRASVTAQSMQATLRQLELLGAAERRTPPGRGRTARLHLTASGRQLLARGQAAIDAADRELLAVLDAEQRQQLMALLLQVFVDGVQRRPGPAPAAPE